MSLFFINDAVAQTPAATSSQAGGGLSTILMLVVFFVIFYFLLIRPQSKRAKEHQNLVNNLQKGDEVITTGGILGRITNIDDTILTLALNDTVEIKVQRNAISGILPKGTLKN